jgi:hypothetical protein
LAFNIGDGGVDGFAFFGIDRHFVIAPGWLLFSVMSRV